MPSKHKSILQGFIEKDYLTQEHVDQILQSPTWNKDILLMIGGHADTLMKKFKFTKDEIALLCQHSGTLPITFFNTLTINFKKLKERGFNHAQIIELISQNISGKNLVYLHQLYPYFTSLGFNNQQLVRIFSSRVGLDTKAARNLWYFVKHIPYITEQGFKQKRSTDWLDSIINAILRPLLSQFRKNTDLQNMLSLIRKGGLQYQFPASIEEFEKNFDLDIPGEINKLLEDLESNSALQKRNIEIPPGEENPTTSYLEIPNISLVSISNFFESPNVSLSPTFSDIDFQLEIEKIQGEIVVPAPTPVAKTMEVPTPEQSEFTTELSLDFGLKRKRDQEIGPNTTKRHHPGLFSNSVQSSSNPLALKLSHPNPRSLSFEFAPTHFASPNVSSVLTPDLLDKSIWLTLNALDEFITATHHPSCINDEDAWHWLRKSSRDAFKGHLTTLIALLLKTLDPNGNLLQQLNHKREIIENGICLLLTERLPKNLKIQTIEKFKEFKIHLEDTYHLTSDNSNHLEILFKALDMRLGILSESSWYQPSTTPETLPQPDLLNLSINFTLNALDIFINTTRDPAINQNPAGWIKSSTKKALDLHLAALMALLLKNVAPNADLSEKTDVERQHIEMKIENLLTLHLPDTLTYHSCIQYHDFLHNHLQNEDSNYYHLFFKALQVKAMVKAIEEEARARQNEQGQFVSYIQPYN